MKQPVPLNKQSKRAQRPYHPAQRGVWHGLPPVTRVRPARKVSDRNRATRAARPLHVQPA